MNNKLRESPYVVHKRGVFCFGLARWEYFVEDRETGCKEDNFKNYINIYVLWYRVYNWTFRSEYLYDYLPYKG